MNLFDSIEWMEIAEQDLFSAKILNEHYRKPVEVICHLCAQSAEKHLKGFITYHDLEPDKTHNLHNLLKVCINIDDSFNNILAECNFINKFTTNIRYPHRREVSETDADHCIRCVEKIMTFPLIKNLIDATKDSSNQN